MDFIHMWNYAIETDPYWQLEELFEEDPELAGYLWYEHKVMMLALRRLEWQLYRIRGNEKE